MTAEYGVIGSIMINPECLPEVRAILTESDFQTEQGRIFFRAVCRMADEGKPIDVITVLAAGINEEWISQLVDTVPTAAYVCTYAEQMKREGQTRTLKAMFNRLAEQDADPAALISEAKAGLDQVTTSSFSGLISQEEAMQHFAEHLAAANAGESLSVTTGFPSVDEILGNGMVKEGLYIVAARPGVGKTSFGLTAADLASKKHRVLFVSLEMSEVQIMARRYANISGCGITRLLYGTLQEGDGDKLAKTTEMLWKRQMTLSNKIGVTVADIEVMCRSCGAELAVIDYLGLIQGEGQSIYERVTKVSGDLKRMARSLKIPVLCLAQLNRTSESRADKRPSMSDLRDSGAIEQDADAILLLHRPGLYWETQPTGGKEQPFEIQIAKNRHGPTGMVTLGWYALNGRFQDEKGQMNSWQ
jgi:replicative DNA helicase